MGRSVARNNLFKAAIFGNDPNWGRVLAAIGTTAGRVRPVPRRRLMNGVRVCSDGGPDRPREEVDLTQRAVCARHRPQGRRRRGHDPHQRPHPRLRPREQRVRVMTEIDLQDTDPDEASEKAATLIESLPWLRRFRDQIIVIKYGGNAMVSEELQDAFAADIAYLRYVGVKPVVVHGGGPQISSMLDRLDIPSEFKGGYRVTSTEAISVVRMVLTGQINPQLVGKINAHGPLATGLSRRGCRPLRRSPSRRHRERRRARSRSRRRCRDGRPAACPRPDRGRAHPGRLEHRTRPRSPGSFAECERGCRGRRSRRRAEGREARRADRCPGSLRRLAEPRLAGLALDLDRAPGACSRRSNRA